MKALLTIIAVSLLLQGCASNPPGSEPAYVKYLEYKPMSEYYRDAYYRRANSDYLRRVK